jgi:hypothetical protein
MSDNVSDKIKKAADHATDRWHNRCSGSQVDRQAAPFHEGGPRSV